MIGKSVLFRISYREVEGLHNHYDVHSADDNDPYVYVKPEYFMRGLEKLDDDELEWLQSWIANEIDGRKTMDEEFAHELAIAWATSANDDPIPNQFTEATK